MSWRLDIFDWNDYELSQVELFYLGELSEWFERMNNMPISEVISFVWKLKKTLRNEISRLESNNSSQLADRLRWLYNSIIENLPNIDVDKYHKTFISVLYWDLDSYNFSTYEELWYYLLLIENWMVEITESKRREVISLLDRRIDNIYDKNIRKILSLILKFIETWIKQSHNIDLDESDNFDWNQLGQWDIYSDLETESDQETEEITIVREWDPISVESPELLEDSMKKIDYYSDVLTLLDCYPWLNTESELFSSIYDLQTTLIEQKDMFNFIKSRLLPIWREISMVNWGDNIAIIMENIVDIFLIDDTTQRRLKLYEFLMEQWNYQYVSDIIQSNHFNDVPILSQLTNEDIVEFYTYPGSFSAMLSLWETFIFHSITDEFVDRIWEVRDNAFSYVESTEFRNKFFPRFADWYEWDDEEEWFRVYKKAIYENFMISNTRWLIFSLFVEHLAWDFAWWINSDDLASYWINDSSLEIFKIYSDIQWYWLFNLSNATIDQILDWVDDLAIFLLTEAVAIWAWVFLPVAWTLMVNAMIFWMRWYKGVRLLRWLYQSSRFMRWVAWVTKIWMEWLLFYEWYNIAHNYMAWNELFDWYDDMNNIIMSILWIWAMRWVQSILWKLWLSIKPWESFLNRTVKFSTASTIEWTAIYWAMDWYNIVFNEWERTIEWLCKWIIMAMMFRMFNPSFFKRREEWDFKIKNWNEWWIEVNYIRRSPNKPFERLIADETPLMYKIWDWHYVKVIVTDIYEKIVSWKSRRYTAIKQIDDSVYNYKWEKISWQKAESMIVWEVSLFRLRDNTNIDKVFSNLRVVDALRKEADSINEQLAILDRELTQWTQFINNHFARIRSFEERITELRRSSWIDPSKSKRINTLETHAHSLRQSIEWKERRITDIEWTLNTKRMSESERNELVEELTKLRSEMEQTQNQLNSTITKISELWWGINQWSVKNQIDQLNRQIQSLQNDSTFIQTSQRVEWTRERIVNLEKRLTEIDELLKNIQSIN